MSEPGESTQRPPSALVIIAVAAIGCLVFGLVSKQWLYNPRTHASAVMASYEYAFGPISMYRCAPQHDTAPLCESMSNRDLVADFRSEIDAARKRVETLPPGSSPDLMVGAQAEATMVADMLQTSSAFTVFGWVTAVSSAITVLSLVCIAGLVLANKRVLVPIMPTTTALLGVIIGLVSGCLFVAAKPGSSGFVGVSYGFWVFGAGCVLGLAAATLLNKHIRPLDLDLLEDAMDPENY